MRRQLLFLGLAGFIAFLALAVFLYAEITAPEGNTYSELWWMLQSYQAWVLWLPSVVIAFVVGFFFGHFTSQSRDTYVNLDKQRRAGFMVAALALLVLPSCGFKGIPPQLLDCRTFGCASGFECKPGAKREDSALYVCIAKPSPSSSPPPSPTPPPTPEPSATPAPSPSPSPSATPSPASTPSPAASPSPRATPATCPPLAKWGIGPRGGRGFFCNGQVVDRKDLHAGCKVDFDTTPKFVDAERGGIKPCNMETSVCGGRLCEPRGACTVWTLDGPGTAKPEPPNDEGYCYSATVKINGPGHFKLTGCNPPGVTDQEGVPLVLNAPLVCDSYEWDVR